MKNHTRLFHSRQGNTLVLTLVVTGVLGFLLVAYLSLVRSQNISNMRSQSWNQTIPVIEAGIEDALTHLNTHGLTNLGPNVDYWNKLGNIYYLKRWVGEHYYVVSISNWVPSLTNWSRPVIESRGFVLMPNAVADPCVGKDQVMAVSGYAALASSYLGRGVRITTRQDWRFTKGLVAKGVIDMKGNNVTTDSFDSSDPLYSTGGLYDKFKRKANGDVATTAGITNSMNIGNANIWGRVSTGPNGTIAIGPLGTIGDAKWQQDPTKRGKIQSGYLTDDMNVDFADVVVPFSGGYDPRFTTNYNGVDYDYVLQAGNYQVSDMSSGNMLVMGNASLYVPGAVNLSGIRILPGASLQLYVGGADVTISGNGVVNEGGNCTNFYYYGLPSNTSLKLSGNGTFSGVIYAPNADLTLKGSGTTPMDIVGASVTKTVTMNGHFNFHYDEALAKNGPFRGYIVTSWNEMTPQEMGGGVIDTSPKDVIQ